MVGGSFLENLASANVASAGKRKAVAPIEVDPLPSWQGGGTEDDELTLCSVSRGSFITVLNTKRVARCHPLFFPSTDRN